MAYFEGSGDDITATRGIDETNRVYWTISQNTELDTYGLLDGWGIGGISTVTHVECQPNEDNLAIMEEYSVFIDMSDNPAFFPCDTKEH